MSDSTKTQETEQQEEFKLSFGKFKGKTLDQVYQSGVLYLIWLSEQDFLNDETKNEIKNYLDTKTAKKKNFQEMKKPKKTEE